MDVRVEFGRDHRMVCRDLQHLSALLQHCHICWDHLCDPTPVEQLDKGRVRLPEYFGQLAPMEGTLVPHLLIIRSGQGGGGGVKAKCQNWLKCVRRGKVIDYG
jgi:hypothetical protein